MAGHTLVVGLGSFHGDDQIGLQVAEYLAARASASFQVRTAESPIQLLDWLDNVEHLFVCDGCKIDAPPGSIRRWNWPSAEIEALRFIGSHDIPLAAVLELAHRLNRLPRRVSIFGVAIGDTNPTSSLSPEVSAALPGVAEQILQAIDER